MRGVGPIIREESSMLLAGVTKGFLVDLNPDRDMLISHYWATKLEKGVKKEEGKKKDVSPSDGGALLTD